MNRKPKTDQKKSGGGEEEAVASLLRAAEDDVLLNLSLNSHMSRGISHSSNSYIDPDLDRRFQSLKSSRRLPTSTKNPSPQPPPSDGADLVARFAALKGDSISLPSSSSSSSRFQESNYLQSGPGKIANSDAVDQDEVQKLIEWAIDAARLDPSPPTDSDDENHHDDDDDDSSNDDDSNFDEGFKDHGGTKDNRKKGRRNKGQNGK